MAPKEKAAIDEFFSKICRGDVTPYNFSGVIGEIAEKFEINANDIWDECAFIANQAAHDARCFD